MKRIIINILTTIFIILGVTSFAAVIVTNLTFMYPWMVSAWDLEAATGLSSEVLMYNYRILINYLNFPWITTLYLPDFPMSWYGEFHFWEVKVIYHVMHVIMLLFTGWLIFIWKKQVRILKYFNFAANTMIILFGVVLAVLLIDFDFGFYWFHRLFFNNDYWLFNPTTDPVILALPYQLFMIKGILIIGVLFVFSAVVKWFNFKRRKKLL